MRFYRCPRPSLYSKWSQLINRKDFKITKDTKVCSNHFKAGKPTKEDPIPSLNLKGYSLNQTDNKRRPPRIRDEIPRKTRKMEALNCLTSVERNEMHNHIGNENVEPQIDFCNENFSESLLPLHSKTDSETNNVQIHSESVTVEECVQDSINREKNVDPLLEHCYQNTNEGTAGCTRSTPNPYYVCSHCSKLRYHITKLQQDVEKLKCQAVNLEEVKKEFKVKG